MSDEWQIPDAPAAVPWGDGELDLGLPSDWPVFVARPEPAPPPADTLAQMLERALAQPIGCEPLARIARKLSERSGARIAVVVDDNTRHTPLAEALPIVLGQLAAGRLFRDDQVEIHFAGGMHGQMTPAQMAERIGPELAARFACFNNPWHDPSAYRTLGRSRGGVPIHLSARVADADLRVLIGSIAAHVQAGFAGGLKLLFPGMASLATIRRLHLKGSERFGQLVGASWRDSPMRREIDGLGDYLDGTTFNVQLMLDERLRPVAAAAGEPVASQRSLAESAARRFGVPVPGQADLLVANGFPLEYDFWQGFKGLANTLFAVRPGGVVVATMKADRGANGMKLPRRWVSRRFLRAVMAVTGRDGLLSVIGRLAPQVNAEAKFFARFALETIRRNCVLVYSPSLAAEGVRFPGLEIFASFPSLWRRAERLLAQTAPRVTVFPHGGVCYPLLSPTAPQRSTPTRP